MSFWILCNWCGADLGQKPHAVLKVAITGRPSPGLLDRDEVRPTLHLCVEPTQISADDFDRMGLDDDDDDADGGCYAKTLAFIEGRPTDPPDMGMEWRLVPAGTPHVEPRSVGPRVRARDDFDDFARLYTRRREPGGLYDLCKRNVPTQVPARAWHAILGTEIATVDQLAAVPDEQLLALSGVGITSLARIREAIDAYRQMAAADPTEVT